MPLDSCMIAALAKEFREKLIGAKIEKIHQPERDRIDLYLRAAGRQAHLTLCAAPGSPRVFLTTQPRENPAVPPMFCLMLRKHLGGGILRSVEQPGFERMLIFRFFARDEMGYDTRRAIVLEMMGKYANLIFTGEDDRIIGVLRPVDFSSSEKRQLLAGMTYELPPAQEGKTDPLTETREGFFEKLTLARQRQADKHLFYTYRGFSPLTAREIAYRAAGSVDFPVHLHPAALWAAFDSEVSDIRHGVFSPSLLRFANGKCEYAHTAAEQYGDAAEITRYDGASALLDDYFAKKEREERIRLRAQDLYKLISGAEARLMRKIEAQRAELAQCADKEKYKQYGELITANLYALRKGDRSVRLINYFSEDMPEVTLILDERLTPAQNAQRFFKKYTKAKTAERELNVQIAKATEELSYLATVRDALDRAVLPSETEEVRAELEMSGYLSQKKRPTAKKPVGKGFLRYVSSDGFTILCGRNNLQNDALSMKIADKNDWWFHVHNAPGSHVILVCEGVDDPPARTFTEACMIAAANSSLSGSARVTVDYTRVKNLKKPPGARPGYVIYHSNYSAEVGEADVSRFEKK